MEVSSLDSQSSDTKKQTAHPEPVSSDHVQPQKRQLPENRDQNHAFYANQSSMEQTTTLTENDNDVITWMTASMFATRAIEQPGKIVRSDTAAREAAREAKRAHEDMERRASLMEHARDLALEHGTRSETGLGLAKWETKRAHEDMERRVSLMEQAREYASEYGIRSEIELRLATWETKRAHEDMERRALLMEQAREWASEHGTRNETELRMATWEAKQAHEDMERRASLIERARITNARREAKNEVNAEGQRQALPLYIFGTCD